MYEPLIRPLVKYIHHSVDLYLNNPTKLPNEFMYVNESGNKVPIPIGKWDVTNITDMSSLFASNAVFNEDISEWLRTKKYGHKCRHNTKKYHRVPIHKKHNKFVGLVKNELFLH